MFMPFSEVWSPTAGAIALTVYLAAEQFPCLPAAVMQPFID
jgi:hypothetical protein